MWACDYCPNTFEDFETKKNLTPGHIEPESVLEMLSHVKIEVKIAGGAKYTQFYIPFISMPVEVSNFSQVTWYGELQLYF